MIHHGDCIEAMAAMEPESVDAVVTDPPYVIPPPPPTVAVSASVRVSMDEFAGWPPSRIDAFFGGVAKLLAAVNGEPPK